MTNELLVEDVQVLHRLYQMLRAGGFTENEAMKLIAECIMAKGT